MQQEIILASGSQIRAHMLRSSCVPFRIVQPRIDEVAVRAALLAEQASARDIADALAEIKALRISDKSPGALVIGCDQTLETDGEILAKAEDRDEAVRQIRHLQGKRHSLFSAAVIVENGQPIWRHVGSARLFMRPLSDGYIQDYVARNWDSVQSSVGGYKIEEEGIRLFTRVEGDHFTILGMPLFELLNYLTVRGILRS